MKLPSASQLLDDPYFCFDIQDRPEIVLELQLFSQNEQIGIPIFSKYKKFEQKWDEWISLRFNFCDLPLDVQLAITIWRPHSPGKIAAVGGTCFRLFHKTG